MVRLIGFVGSVLAGTILGVGFAALRISVGRDLVVRGGLQVANEQLNGRVEVGNIGGTVYSGLDLGDVPIAWISRLQLSYGLRDLMGGRVVLGTLTLTDPRVDIIQWPDGRTNVKHFLGLYEPSDGGGVNPFIAFGSVGISGGMVRVLSPGPVDAIPKRADEGRAPQPPPPLSERRFEEIDARLPSLRLSSPLPSQHAMRVEISALSVRSSDPALDIKGARGSFELEGDSIELNLPEITLPSSVAALEGRISWPRDTIEFDLEIGAETLAFDDVQAFLPALPPGLSVEGSIVVRGRGGVLGELAGRNFILRDRVKGGSAKGRFRMVGGGALLGGDWKIPMSGSETSIWRTSGRSWIRSRWRDRWTDASGLGVRTTRSPSESIGSFATRWSRGARFHASSGTASSV